MKINLISSNTKNIRFCIILEIVCCSGHGSGSGTMIFIVS